MALLERHGIGNGKYKIGGSYPESIFSLDLNKGNGETLLNITHADTAANLRAIETDNEGNFYVGSQAGTFSLTKYDAQGSLLWEVNHNSGVTWLKYDPLDDVIWAHEPSSKLTCYDLDGGVLFDVTFNYTNIVDMVIDANHLYVGVFGNSSTSTPVIHIFDKTGSSVRTMSYIGLRAFNVIDNAIYLLDSTTLRKISIEGAPLNDVTFRAIANAAARGNIQKDLNNNIYVWTASATSNALCDLYVYNTSLVEIRRSIRTANSLNPEATTFINIEDLAWTNFSYLLSNGQSYPTLISAEGTGVTNRQLNELLKVTAKQRLVASGTANSNRYKWATLDKDLFTYVVTAKSIYKLDFRQYKKIFK